MRRARIAALAALLAIPSAMGVQAVGLVDVEAGPTQIVAVSRTEEQVAISAKVQPATAIPGRMTAAVQFFARKPRFWGVFRPWRRSPWFSSSWPSLCRLAYEGLPGFTKSG